MVSEWFGSHAGRSMGLNTREPAWIFLEDSLEYAHLYIEIRDLIDKSLGINIGFPYIENAKEIKPGDLSDDVRTKLVDVYLLDLLMLNIDRSLHNYNLLSTNVNKILITDFDSSLIFTGMLKGVNPLSDKRVLECLRSNPFYQFIESDKLLSFLAKMNQVDFHSIISEVPDVVLNHSDKTLILNKMEDKKKRDWDLLEILEKIDEIKLESEEEKNLRIKKNRKKLEDLVAMQKLKK